uniref:Uncharacterized protein n=1 Tax=Mesocestoides corti TaxID=53468 RepID=A0A5K3EJP2_MESCO
MVRPPPAEGSLHLHSQKSAAPTARTLAVSFPRSHGNSRLRNLSTGFASNVPSTRALERSSMLSWAHKKAPKKPPSSRYTAVFARASCPLCPNRRPR